MVLRFTRLRGTMELDSVLSREATFVVNNWLLLGICAFIVVATTWPKINEWVWHERLTVGPSFYNFWLPVPGCLLLAVMGISGDPVAQGVVVAVVARVSRARGRGPRGRVAPRRGRPVVRVPVVRADRADLFVGGRARRGGDR